MDEQVRSIFHAKAAKEGYARKVGMRLVDLDEGYALVEMTPGAEDINLHGAVHGGAILSLMEEAFQISCNSYGTVAVALSVNVVFHRPAVQGRRLRAESKESHRSRKTAAYEIRVTDETNALVASCQALAYRKRDALPFLGEK